MSAVGRWFVTPHAVSRYIERIDRRATYEQALGELVAQSERAHLVRRQDNGTELWRGPKPLRLRLIVAPATSSGELPQLMTVLGEHDRWRPKC